MTDVAILRKPVVRARTGLSDSTIRRLISRGEFPAPVQLGARSVGWKSDLIDHWIESRQAPSIPRVGAAHEL